MLHSGQHLFPIVLVLSLTSALMQIEDKEFPTCDEFALMENSLTPKPFCHLEADPNQALLNSLGFQMFIVFGLIVVMIVFGLQYLWRLWRSQWSDTHIKDNIDRQKEESVEKNKHKTSEIVEQNDKNVQKLAKDGIGPEVTAKRGGRKRKSKRSGEVERYESPVEQKEWTGKDREKNYQTILAKKPKMVSVRSALEPNEKNKSPAKS